MATTEHYDLDNDTTLGGAGASDLIIPSQKAVKTYVDNNSGGGGSSTLSGLTDVTLTSPSNGQVLGYDGSDWVNKGLKTINSQTIVGSGNIAVQSPLTAGDNITFTYGSNNWTAATQKANLSSLDETLNITYGNGVLVSVDRYGHSCRSTDDGATWSTPIQFSNEEWFGSCYGDGKFVSISDTGYLYISTDDGAIYNNGEYVGVLHTNIAYGNGLWIALTYNGYTAYANDLSNWSAQQYNSDLGNRDWSKPIWDGNKFIALSPHGYMATTTDGVNYAVSSTDLDTNFTWYAFGYNGSEYIVIGTNGEVATSANCVNWTSPTFISNLGNYGWQDVAYNGSNLIAIGSYGYISTSETSQIISANEIFVAEYGVTTYQDILTAYNSSKILFVYFSPLNYYAPLFRYNENASPNRFSFSFSSNNSIFNFVCENKNGNNEWSQSSTNLADTDLSNLTDDGKISIAHNAMPSTTITDTLSVGSSGGYYDAPADGYYFMGAKTTSNTHAYINLGGVVSGVYGSGNNVGVKLSVVKGQRVYYYYNNVNTFTSKFEYAVGAESEKV